MAFGGQFSYEGAKLLLEKGIIEPAETLYIGLIRKRGEPDPQGEVINDETEMIDIETEGDNSYFEEIDTGYGRQPLSDWGTVEPPEAPEEPEHGEYEGNKPARVTNSEAVEFGPWVTGHIDEEGNPTHTELEEESADEIVGVFVTTAETGYEGDFLAYQNITMGHQLQDGETLRIPEGRLRLQLN